MVTGRHDYMWGVTVNRTLLKVSTVLLLGSLYMYKNCVEVQEIVSPVVKVRPQCCNLNGRCRKVNEHDLWSTWFFL